MERTLPIIQNRDAHVYSTTLNLYSVKLHRQPMTE